MRCETVFKNDGLGRNESCTKRARFIVILDGFVHYKCKKCTQNDADDAINNLKTITICDLVEGIE